MRELDDFTEVLAFLRPGASIVLHSGCAEPRHLAGQLARHAASLRDMRLYTLMPMGEAPYAASESRLAVTTFFPGKGLRDAARSGRVEVMRTSLRGIPDLFRDRSLSADVLMLQLSAPDEAGRMSLGLSVDYMPAVLAQRPLVIAEINPRMPRTCGDTMVRADQVDYVVPAQELPQAVATAEPDEVDRRIAENIAALIPDGAVIQTGIGSLPSLVLSELAHLRDLGIHTGIITDAVMPLIARGVVTNAAKKRFRGVSITTMAAGSQDFYDALDRNAGIEFHPCSLTHDVGVIAELADFRAINSVLQIDLAGRANAESADGRIVSAPGGLPDFARGATLSKGGASIIALRSTTRGGRRSNIVADLDRGAPVTVEPDHIDYVVTEHGVARLRGLDAGRRARALAAIADPSFRAELRQHALC